jgi:heat shock protein HtpX
MLPALMPGAERAWGPGRAAPPPALPVASGASRRGAAAGLALAPGAAVGAAAGAVAGVFAGAPAGAAVAAVLAVAGAAATWRAGAPVALALCRARPAGPAEQPRLHNLVEGLCAAAGLSKPHLYVVEDQWRNSFAVGRSPRHASLVVTTGLIDSLDRVELEGVLAHELSHVKADDVSLSSVVAATLGCAAVLVPALCRAANAVAGRDREQLADLAAVTLTRYPPGLISALEAVRDSPSAASVSRAALRATSHLWLARTSGAFGGFPTRLDQRIQALREL